MTPKLSASHVHFPAEYGDPTASPLREWSEVEAKLRNALNYWVTTLGPAGLPHVRPVDGVWVEGTLCFGGSNETRWVRNLRANPAMTVNLGSEAEAIILEGQAEEVTDPKHPLAKLTDEASRKKYPQYYKDDAGLPEFQPFWSFRPVRAYAWTLDGFPSKATRWRFSS